ncbi:MAG TPA: peptidylprolyl isomerase [Pilimelia sp.]|nr:peptidylprolyl isomerase [Pilimelia sp.]
MVSSNERQRMLARAKRERQLARRAARLRRRRQALAGGATAAAVLLLVTGGAWFFGGDDDPPLLRGGSCGWTRLDATAHPRLTDVGEPPREDNPHTGQTPLVLATSLGEIGITLEQGSAPCAVASVRHLVGRAFYRNTRCHELTTDHLRCGDPTGTGEGGPTYALVGENLPAPAAGASPSPGTTPQYLRGAVALAPTVAGEYGGQFVIVHKDIHTTAPTLAPIGFVHSGMHLVDKVVRGGTAAGGRTPKTALTITSATIDGTGIPAEVPTDSPPGGPNPSATGR